MLINELEPFHKKTKKKLKKLLTKLGYYPIPLVTEAAGAAREL